MSRHYQVNMDTNAKMRHNSYKHKTANCRVIHKPSNDMNKTLENTLGNYIHGAMDKDQKPEAQFFENRLRIVYIT